MPVDTKVAEGKNEFELEALEVADAASKAREEIAAEKGEKPPEKKEAPNEEGKEEGVETPEDKAAKVKADEDKAKAKEEKELAKKKEAEEILLKTDDKELDEDSRYKKIAIQKIRDDEKKKVEDDMLKGFSEKRKISIDDARKELEHIGKVSEKYKNDPKELAEAYLHIQRSYTKSQEELKRFQETAPIKAIEKLTDEDIIADVIDAGKITVKGKVATREEIIESYRRSHANMDEVDDTVVLTMIASTIRQGMISQKTSQMQDVKLKAKDKRIELVSGLEEKDKEFAETVKKVIENHSDEAILSDSFSVQDIIRWAKGEKYDELAPKQADEIKKAYDEGFQKGKENAKILGVKSSETSPKESKGSKTVTLSDREKQEALNMFDTDSMTDDEKYASYSEIQSKRKKEKK
jgi:hypothetical protein